MSLKFFLGLQSYASADSGASIVQVDTTSKIIDYVCISEERLIRKKNPYSFPIHSINYCLDYFKLKDLSKIDYIISDWIKIKRWERSGPSYNYSEFDYYKEKLKFNKKKIIQINHHLAHAASVFYTSQFKESAILIVDGVGSDLETVSFYKGNGNYISLLKNYREFGIGSAYSAVTKFILNFGTGGEGKTMGLAPYGKKNKNQIIIEPNLKGIETDFSNFMRRHPLSDILNQLNNNLRVDPIKVHHKNCDSKNYLSKYFSGVAHDIQSVAEKVMIHLGSEIYKCFKSDNICLAGGVALNSVANKKLLDNSKFKNMFVFPACSDAGIPFGAALWGAFNLIKGIKKKHLKFNNAYTGKEYSNNEIIELLNKFNINFSIYSKEKIVEYIKNKKIIGRCSGKSEYGPRALGNRSILADARDKKIRNYLNREVKHREMFRPFAPVVLEENSKEYFDLKQSSPYMLLVAKSHKAKQIPSSIHIDNSARVQTVNETENKDLYDLIRSFHKITNVPIILNTSFNDAGEPIVESPLDALICFYQTKIDYLVLNNFIIEKKNYNIINLNKLKKYRRILIQHSAKKIIKKILKPISKREFIKKKKLYTKEAIFFAIENSKIKLINFIKQNLNKRILIVGTNDHTYIMCKYIKNYLEKIDLTYYEFKKNDFLKNKKHINIKKENNLKNTEKYDYIIISSYEYQSHIKKKIFLLVKKAKIFEIYDNCSRSLVDTYFINDLKMKKKYSKMGKEQNYYQLLDD